MFDFTNKNILLNKMKTYDFGGEAMKLSQLYIFVPFTHTLYWSKLVYFV